MRHTKTTLKNGMRVITVPMKDTKSLTLLALFGTGSRYETKKTNGVSHFLEHLFFKGTTSRPRPGDVSQALDDVGCKHNGFTSKEYTGYWVKAASRHIPLALDIVSDILIEPLFKAEEIEKERGVIFQEMHMYLDTPRRYVHDLFESLVYGDEPLGWEIIGTSHSLRGLTRKDILAYRKSQYVGSNAVLVVAGSFHEEDTLGRIKKAFERLPAGSAKPCSPFSVIKKDVSRVHLEFKKSDQTHVVIGARSNFSMFHDERYAVALLATILGGKTKEVVRRIRDEFWRAGESGISSRELRQAKDFWRGQFAISLESSDEVASFYGTHELFYKDVVSPEEVMEKIEHVTREEVTSVAQEIFHKQSVCLALIGPHRDDMAYEQLIRV